MDLDKGSNNLGLSDLFHKQSSGIRNINRVETVFDNRLPRSVSCYYSYVSMFVIQTIIIECVYLSI